MKYCRFQLGDQAHYGLVESSGGQDTILRILLTPPEQAGGDMESLRTKRIEPIPLQQAELLAPVQPSKIVCMGRNYRDHAVELGHDIPSEPLMFLKANSSLLAPGARVLRPKLSQRVDYEGELAVVIGKTCHHVGADEDVRPYILGYTCLNDVTARDLQNKDGQWSRAKGFDTFCPMGPLVSDEIDPWTGVIVETRVNSAVRQHASTLDFLFGLDALIRYFSAAMTLFPGDVIATGTPSGVGPVVAGDVMEVSIDGIGTLRNPVADE